jgi:hypothetical protein
VPKVGHLSKAGVQHFQRVRHDLDRIRSRLPRSGAIGRTI